jgi:hypothetical protein
MVPMKAASIGVDESCGGTPPVGLVFDFPVPASAGGISAVCFTPTTGFFALDFDFSAPPAAIDLTCSSTVFATCLTSQTGNTTEVSFLGGPGIPDGVDFRVALAGFTVGQTIDAVADSPEPATLPLCGLIAISVLAISVVRRATLQ